MKNVVITILCILVMGLGCFIVYDKVINKNEKKENNVVENNDNVEVKEESFDLSAAKGLIDKYVSGIDMYLEDLKKSGLTENIKLAMAIANANPDKTVSCSDAFDFDGNEYSLNNSKYGCTASEKRNAISYNLVNTEYKKLFGNSAVAPKTYAPYNYDYSTKLNSYVQLHMIAGTGGDINLYFDVESAKMLNNKLTVVISYLNYTEIMGRISSSVNGQSHTFTSVEELKAFYNNNKATLPRLTFNFEKQNGNYILTSVN